MNMVLKKIQKESKKKNIDSEFVFNLVFWVVLIGIIGARLYYVLFSLNEYNKFIDIFF